MKIPSPNGCAHCGEPQRFHGKRWTEGVGLHKYAEPTDAQRKARMLARRAARKGTQES